MSGSEEIRIDSADDVSLAATLTLPAWSRRSPALIGVHGANMGTRDAYLFQHLQVALTEQGVATLFFDRRGEAASTGELTNASFDDLAIDVDACVRYLRSHPRVEGEKIGLWCFSQGGWIAALAAARDPKIAFLIAVSPSGVSAADQMKYAAAYSLREAGYSEPVVEKVMAIREQIDGYFRGRTKLKEARALFEAARAEPWFELAWLPEPTQAPNRWQLQMDFDIRPVLGRVRCPVLLLVGEWDRWVPIEITVETWRGALGPAADLTVARIPGAGHHPTLPANRRDLSESGPIALTYERLLISWLQNHLSYLHTRSR